MSEVTERIDSVLLEKGITKQEFYKACKISSSAYSQWNRGHTSPRTAKLKEIADYLSVNYEWLFLGVGDKEKAPISEDERPVSDDEIKFALWGTKEINDDVLDRVKQFAKFAQEEEKSKNS